MTVYVADISAKWSHVSWPTLTKRIPGNPRPRTETDEVQS